MTNQRDKNIHQGIAEAGLDKTLFSQRVNQIIT